MLNPKLFDDLAQRLSDAVPLPLREAGQDLEKNFRSILQGALSKLEIVGREEFDAQAAVLARTREKVAQLEAQVTALEVHLGIVKTPSQGESRRLDDDDVL
jgi:ubiquinone biosynthesis accessory factor UbiK